MAAPPPGALVYKTTAQPMLPSNRIITDVSAFYGVLNVPVIAVNEDVLAGELYNLASTLVGDEPFLPTFGCDMPRYVFEPITALLQQEMFLDLYLQAQTWLRAAAVVPGSCRVVAAPGNRTAGAVIAYTTGSDAWELPVNLIGSLSSGFSGG